MRKGSGRTAITEGKNYKVNIDIGDGYEIVGHGMDINGNHVVRVAKGDGRAKSIQTNGNLPVTHRELRGITQKDIRTGYLDKDKIQAIASEVLSYLQKNESVFEAYRIDQIEGEGVKIVDADGNVSGYVSADSFISDMDAKSLDDAISKYSDGNPNRDKAIRVVIKNGKVVSECSDNKKVVETEDELSEFANILYDTLMKNTDNPQLDMDKVSDDESDEHDYGTHVDASQGVINIIYDGVPFVIKITKRDIDESVNEGEGVRISSSELLDALFDNGYEQDFLKMVEDKIQVTVEFDDQKDAYVVTRDPHNNIQESVNESSDEERDEIWDYLLEMGIATEDELRLVTNINGFTKESLESIIYAKTGYRNLEQLKSEYDDEDVDECRKKIKEMMEGRVMIKKIKEADEEKKAGSKFQGMFVRKSQRESGYDVVGISAGQEYILFNAPEQDTAMSKGMQLAKVHDIKFSYETDPRSESKREEEEIETVEPGPGAVDPEVVVDDQDLNPVPDGDEDGEAVTPDELPELPDEDELLDSVQEKTDDQLADELLGEGVHVDNDNPDPEKKKKELTEGAGEPLKKGDEVDGQTVLMAGPVKDNGQVVLKYWKAKDEYVVHLYDVERGGFTTGNYFQELEPAMDKYKERNKANGGIEEGKKKDKEPKVKEVGDKQDELQPQDKKNEGVHVDNDNPDPEKKKKELTEKAKVMIVGEGKLVEKLKKLLEGKAELHEGEDIIEEEEGYQGWKNYATWGVALIIDNDRGLLDMALEKATGAYIEDKENMQYTLRDQLKDWVEDELVNTENMSEMESQMVNAGLAEVDWSEIGEHYKTTFMEHDVEKLVAEYKENFGVDGEDDEETIEDRVKESLIPAEKKIFNKQRVLEGTRYDQNPSVASIMEKL